MDFNSVSFHAMMEILMMVMVVHINAISKSAIHAQEETLHTPTPAKKFVEMEETSARSNVTTVTLSMEMAVQVLA